MFELRDRATIKLFANVEIKKKNLQKMSIFCNCILYLYFVYFVTVSLDFKMNTTQEEGGGEGNAFSIG